MKKISKILLTFVTLFSTIILFNMKVFANNENYVYLGGENIGIKVNTGIEVVGKYEVETTDGKIKPWKNSDIQKGDKIICVNGVKVDNNQSLLNILKTCKAKSTKLTVERNAKIFETPIDIVISSNNQKSLGLYIKDKILGIGTLTFIEPQSNLFASLGHGIYDENELSQIKSGVILKSTVNSVRKATPGNAGEKKATLDNKVVGTIYKNTNTGLYGKVVDSYIKNRKKVEIGLQEEVSIGPATIVTTLSDNITREYDIEIIEVNSQKTKDIKGLKIKITDQKLINETGGIVQGMSGSPILQNGKIIGAVSHVVVDNPTVGYGMLIEWMINESKN